MYTDFVVQLLKNGSVVPGTTRQVAKNESHPGIEEAFYDWLTLILLNIIQAVAARFGVGTYDYDNAMNLAKQVFAGCDKNYLAKQAIQIKVDQSFDHIQIVFRGSSEDELKSETCKIVTHPIHAEAMGENLSQYYYDAGFLLDTTNLPEGLHTFIGGAQDDGWFYDVANSSQLDIFFVVPQAATVPTGRALDNDPIPPAHQGPNIPVADEIAARYAVLNVLLAECGVDLGGVGANSPSQNVHFEWARQQRIPQIEEETVRKVRILARRRDLFSYLYALLSTEMAKMTHFSDPGAGSLVPSAHYDWCEGNVQHLNSTVQVRDVLLDKIYFAFETSLSLMLPTILQVRPDALSTIEQSLADMIRAVPRGHGLKRMEARPSQNIQIAEGVTPSNLGSYSRQSIPLGQSWDISYLASTMRAHR